MKSENKIQEIASRILNLELKCQEGEDVSKNIKEMNRIVSSLSLDEIFLLDEILKEKVEKLNFLI